MDHAAYPQLGWVAIVKELLILSDLRQLPLPVDPLLGPSSVNLGVISGGRAANIVPDEAQAQILFRTVNGAEELREALRRLLDGRCEYEFIRDTPAPSRAKLDRSEP